MDIDLTLTQIVEAANHTPRVRGILHNWDRVIRLSVDGQQYAIIATTQRLSLQKGPTDPTDLGFDLDAHTLESLVLRQTTPVLAKSSGKIKTTGVLTDILKFASILTAVLDGQPAAASTDRRLESGGVTCSARG